jgi:alpha-galactosidase
MKRHSPLLGIVVALVLAAPLAGAESPSTAKQENEAAVLLTPPALPEPRILGPKVYGVRPGAPLLYRIPATGRRPMTFAAEGLPDGVVLDPTSGILSGRVTAPGTHRVTLSATSPLGQSKRELRIVVGKGLALTPPMGWNSWYIHYQRVSDKLVREAAERMIASGMADYGYQYVNIDDCWAVKVNSTDPEIGGPTRDPDGTIRPNRRFPDMKSLADYIHAKGLKAGIYTSPGKTTCGGYEGAFGHEAQDARTFAHWGFDFLKYDWCSYGAVAGGNGREHLERPYKLMWDELQKLDRDVVFNLCQYGMGAVWTWGGEVGNCWRTTGDLGLEAGKGLPGFYNIGLRNARHWENARPGGWNDPDYILIGWVGDAHRQGEGRRTALTAEEQYSYMSMWCLMAAPLIFGGDMAKLDPFTLNVLCNHELIEIDQDALGRQARIVRQTPAELVLAKDLEDGSRAVGLFNLHDAAAKISVTWADLGISGPQRVRDPWRQKDLGGADGKLEIDVPAHGVALRRLMGPPMMVAPRIIIQEEEEEKLGIAPTPVPELSILAPGAKLEKLAGGFKFAEGPARDAQGNVFFTDQPNDRILRWSTDGKLSTFLSPCGRSNGTGFDAQGNLWACADEKNELWCISPAGKATVVVKDYQGKLLNGPNDVWVRPDGGLYITDPYYPRPYWKRGPQELRVEAVYYLAPDRKNLLRVVADMKQPNGIIGTPDGKRLYVSDIGGGRTYVYQIQPDGTLTEKRLFCRLGSDGMTIDNEENVYLTGRGVTVFNSAGRQLTHIQVPEPWTGNLCFGGKDRQTLIITASRGLYSIRTRVHGVGSK